MKRIIFYFIIGWLIPSTLIIGQTREQDSLILVEIYNELDGVNWINSENWLTEAPLEDWSGVSIENDRVSILNRTNIGLSGAFPASVYQLEGLKELKFFSGEIEGNLSEELYNLQNLTKLTISNCGISGEIPFRLDTLRRLERLDLSRNDLQGSLPLLPPELIAMDVRQNNLSGPIPDTYTSIPFWQIDVSSNNLTGSLDIVGSWKGLDKFNGSFNDWNEQPLPLWLDEMPQMRTFTCTECNLSGEIKEYNWNGSPKFYQLIAANNDLSGDIGNLRLEMSDVNYPWIDLTNNSFSGTLPTHKIKQVGRLWLNNNEIEQITTFEYDYLASIRLANNKLTLSELIDEFPKIVQDDDISNYRIADQRSPFENVEMTILEGDVLALQADDMVDGSTYQWYHKLEPIEGANNYSFSKSDIQESDEGKYWYEVSHPEIIDNNGDLVIFKSREWEVSVKKSSNVLDLSKGAIIYPNPTRGTVFLKNISQLSKMTLLDIKGKYLDSFPEGTSQIDLSFLKSGIYFLSISTPTEVYFQKLVKL